MRHPWPGRTPWQRRATTSAAADALPPDDADPDDADPDLADPDLADPDLGADEPERGPQRRCIVTRVSGPKETMLRFVLDPGRVLVPDLAGRLPGRGFWLSAKADVLERGLAKGAFARAARGPVTLPNGLRAGIVDGLRARVRDYVGFARRGGQAICGREAVREWLRAGRVGLLVEASDGSATERERLIGSRPLPVVAPLTASELAAIFGREHVVHAAVAPGRLAGAIAVEAGRLAGIEGGLRGEGTVAAQGGRPGDANPPAPRTGIGFGSTDE